MYNLKLVFGWSIIWLACFRFATACLAQSSAPVAISYSTANPSVLNQGFAGFTTELLGTGIEYADTNMQQLAARLSPGWLLFPAGTTGDAFNWATGQTDSNWVNEIGMRQGPNNVASNLCAGTINALAGKGGAAFTNFARLAGNLGGSKIIVCVNAFTDTPASAGAFAGFSLSNHIPVAVWELCNEPYLFQGTNNFFTNGTDYANKMLPYRNAIKAADPNAVVGVFFSDPARTGMTWDNALGNYTNQYWDAVVYHHYPELPTNSSFSDLMAMDNGVLLSNTTLFVTNTLIPRSHKTNITFLVTELSSNLGNGNGTQNPPTSTLYGGIYASEYVLRLSTVPRVTFAGSYQLVNGSGVDTTNQFWNAVTKAAANGYVTNTVGLPFGYFLSAQGSAEAVAYWALNRSTGVYSTSVGTNGPNVPCNTNSNVTMPAVFAQAYQGGNGRRYVVLTNKGSNAVPVQIVQDGSVLTNQFLETFVTGSDPAAVNSSAQVSPVQIQAQTAGNPLTVPPYSVMRLEWSVFAVPPPSLRLLRSGTTNQLNWDGLTSVVYSLQGAAHLTDAWTTLGKVSGPQTNFSVSRPADTGTQFYRLQVP